jgi:multidrug transporter EmrE-like cation transporter
MLLGLLAALVAALCYGAGDLLEQVGARRAGASEGIDPRLLLRAIRQLPWVAGLALDAIGFLLAIIALEDLPLFAVQAALASSIGVTSVLSSVFLGTRITRTQRIPLVAIAMGLLLVAAAASPERATDVGDNGRIFFVLGVPLIVLLAVSLGRVGAGDRAAARLGAAAGLSFGGAYSGARVLKVPDPVWEVVTQPLAWAIVAYGIIGVLLLSTAFQRGHVTVAIAATFAVETVVPSAIGLVFFGDRARAGLWPVAVTGFLFCAAGSVTLARLSEPAQLLPGGPGGLQVGEPETEQPAE